jgi:HlyD family secretion protein/hemolysin D
MTDTLRDRTTKTSSSYNAEVLKDRLLAAIHASAGLSKLKNQVLLKSKSARSLMADGRDACMSAISSKKSSINAFKEDRNTAVCGSLERQFLPAALEILETPPPPSGRVMALTICAFALIALIWAAQGRIDIVAVAAGKIVTRARTQVVQVSEVGVVKEILVQPGQSVKQGEPLIRLDAATIEAEIDRARSDLTQARLDIARLHSFVDQLTEFNTAALSDIDPILVERTRLQLAAQTQERKSRLAGFERELESRGADLEASEVMLQKANETLPLIQERAEIRSKAAQIEYGSKLLSLEARQQVLDIKAEIRLQQFKIVGLKSTIDGLTNQRDQVSAEFLKTAYNDFARALAQKEAATESLAKASRRLELSVLRSPLDGEVNQLNVRSLGGIVTTGQQLVLISPQNSPLEVEVVVPNRDIAFINQNQEVEVKVDAYPFTRYGLLKGRVVGIAQDAEPQPNAGDGNQSGSQRRADQTTYIEGSERLLYTVRVSIDPDTLQLDGKPAPLMAGMSVRAEIKTGSRSILEFLIAPLSEYLHQSMRER